MSLYDELSTIYDGVNKNPQDMLLLTLTYLKNISPKQNSDRSIVLARLLDYVTKIEEMLILIENNLVSLIYKVNIFSIFKLSLGVTLLISLV